MGINVGIVGYGYAGKVFHSQLIKATEGLNLYAVSSRDPGRREEARSRHGVVTYETLDQMLEDRNVDLVVIATPHSTHKELAVLAMDAGKHVVVDKIMCLSVSEADEMIEASKRNGVLLTVFQNRRWDGDFLTLRRILEEGLLGDVFLVESSVAGYRRPSGWREKREFGGGPFCDWGAHLVDQALIIAGSEPEYVFCDMQYRVWGTDVENYALCSIKFKNDLLYQIEVGNIVKAPKPRWRVLGEKGSFVKDGLDPQEDGLRRGEVGIIREDPRFWGKVRTEVGGIQVEMTVETIPGTWTAFYRNVVNHLTKGEELAVKPEEVRKAIAVIEAAVRSAKEKKGVMI